MVTTLSDPQTDIAAMKYLETLKEAFLVTPEEMTDAVPPHSGSAFHNSMVTLVTESYKIYSEDDNYIAPNGAEMTVNLMIERVRMPKEQLIKLGHDPKKPIVISMNPRENRDFKRDNDVIVTDGIDKTPHLQSNDHHETQLPGRLSITRSVDKNGKTVFEGIDTTHMLDGLEHSVISGKDLIFAETSIQRGHSHGVKPGLTDFVSFKHKLAGQEANFDNQTLINKNTLGEIIFTTGGIPVYSVDNKTGDHVDFNLNDTGYMNDLKNLVKGSHNFNIENENNPSPQIAYSKKFQQ